MPSWLTARIRPARIRRHLRGRGIPAVIPHAFDRVRRRLRQGRAGGRPPAFVLAAYKLNVLAQSYADHPDVPTRVASVGPSEGSAWSRSGLGSQGGEYAQEKEWPERGGRLVGVRRCACGPG